MTPGAAPLPRCARVGYADLVRVLCGVPVGEQLRAAALLGFFHVASPEPIRAPAGRGTEPVEAPSAVEAGAPASFLRLEAATEREPAPGPPPKPLGLTVAELRGRDEVSFPATPPLAPWSTLWPALRRALHSTRLCRDPDVGLLVRMWARGQCLPRLPRRTRTTWAGLAEVWIDRSRRLTPFWDDQSSVWEQLIRLCGRAALRTRLVDASDLETLAAGDIGAVDRAVPVLVLGDLGFHGTAQERAWWLRAAKRLQSEGAQVGALVACAPRRWDRRVARAWNAVPWERPRLGSEAEAPDMQVRALLRVVAPTALAQPGLVRALRRLTRGDVSTETEVWQHVDVQAGDSHGLVLTTAASIRLREEFTQVDPAIQREVGELISRWHQCWRDELLHAETLAWVARRLPGALGDRDAALAFSERLESTMCAGTRSREIAAVLGRFGRKLLGAVPDEAYVAFPALKRVWGASFAGVADARWPRTIDPIDLADAGPAAEVRQRWAVHQRGEALIMMPGGGGAGAGSPVATIAATIPMVRVERPAGATRTWLTVGAEVTLAGDEGVTLCTDCGAVTIGVWKRPAWAVAAGRDRYGLWAAFELAGVEQRVRWIPPGRFLMGSPEDEAERSGSEGRQHWVTITRGYWLGETPVTQALWTAVMGKNPSRFRSDDRPVEQVSWNDCQEFIARLNQALDGFTTRLPTEAEWERACRAETTTATWAGAPTLRGERDAPELDAIAWYYGNSAAGFELDNGEDTSNSPGKRDQGDRRGTRPVRHKLPNPYGLHDMLGNVYEWCQDAADSLANYEADDVDDPLKVQGSLRVVRGGSWLSGVRYVRAAFRNAIERGHRQDDRGFRLAGGQAEPSPNPGEPRSGDGRGAVRDEARATPEQRPKDPGPPKELSRLAPQSDDQGARGAGAVRIELEDMNRWPDRDAGYFYAADVFDISGTRYPARVMIDGIALASFEAHVDSEGPYADIVKMLYRQELDALLRQGKLAPASTMNVVFFVGRDDRQVRVGDIVIYDVDEKLKLIAKLLGRS